MKTKRIAILAVIFGMALSVSAQDVTESKYGADSANCVTKLSIYREYYKQWEAAKFAPESVNGEMISAWREVFLTCPRASQYTYTNGEKILDYLIRRQGLTLTEAANVIAAPFWSTIDGKKELVIPAGVENDKILQIKGAGVPYLGNQNKRGNHNFIIIFSYFYTFHFSRLHLSLLTSHLSLLTSHFSLLTSPSRRRVLVVL